MFLHRPTFAIGSLGSAELLILLVLGLVVGGVIWLIVKLAGRK